MKKAKNLRDYGLPSGEPDGTPTWKKLDQSMPCPNCKCELVHVTIPMKNVPMLRGGSGMGIYLGCPACPFATPMMVAAKEVEN